MLECFFFFLECPIRVTAKFFNRKYMNTGISFNSIRGSHAKVSIRHTQYYKENNTNNRHAFHKNQFYQRNEKYDTKDVCMPRHQMVRVKHAEAFSTAYFLQVFFEL